MTQDTSTPHLMKLFEETLQQEPALTPLTQTRYDLTKNILSLLRNSGFIVTNTQLEGRNSSEIVVRKDAYVQKFVLSVTEGHLAGSGKQKLVAWCEIDGERGSIPSDVNENTALNMATLMVTKLAVRNQTPHEPII